MDPFSVAAIARFFLGYWRQIAVMLVVGGLVWWGLHAFHERDLRLVEQGRQEVRADNAKQHAENERRALALNVRTEREQEEAVARLAKARSAATARAKVITQEVPVYVPASADAACTLNVGFVRVWNDAAEFANGAERDPARPTPRSDDLGRPAGVALSSVATALGQAADRDADLRLKLDACREFAKRVEKWDADIHKGVE